jgi:ketosteroid isomerase-like protein
MLLENVEIARSMIDTWNNGGLEEWLRAFHPDVEFVDHQTAIGMRDRGRGLEELRRASQQWTEVFEGFRVEVREVVDLGGEYVMADIRFVGIGRESGARVSGTQIDVYRIVDGKIVEYQAGFDGRSQALEAVGLTG